MSVFEKLLDGQTKLAVVGLGYVGMPLLFGFADHVQVIGFDISDEKVALCKFGPDSRPDFGKARRNDNILCTNREEDLREAQVIIVAVPTPVHKDNTPDMRILQSASELVGRNLQKGAIVAYESTVYPGATEEVCVPILERASGLKAGVDFKVGYSPERINPGDKFNKLETIVKIVSGMDEETLAELRGVYGLVAKGGIHSVSAIKVAEAAKVAENSQRDTNIAFVNELAMMFHAMGIDTLEVIDAMNSKWNALGFTPGLVGGHCIGVDPHYLLHKAEEMGYTARIIGESRRLNDAVGPYIAREGIKLLSKLDKPLHQTKVAILGYTFKENSDDTRNTKVEDIARELENFGVQVLVYDDHAHAPDVEHEYGRRLNRLEEIEDADCLLVAVAHDEFRTFSAAQWAAFYGSNKQRVLMDIKGIIPSTVRQALNCAYWKL